MTDLFGRWVPDEWIDRCFAVMALTPQHTHQVLTKRPERMAEYLNDPHTPERIALAAEQESGDLVTGLRIRKAIPLSETQAMPRLWPLPNVWLGTSVEDQARADERIPHLLRCPAAVRFLSCEPLLGPVDLGLWSATCKCCPRRNNRWVRLTCNVRPDCGCATDSVPRLLRPGLVRRANSNPHGALDIDGLGIKPSEFEYLGDLHWVIVGGESGDGARPMHPDWARGLRDQCVAAGVPFFFKQFGEWSPEYDFDAPEHTQLHRDGRRKGGLMADNSPGWEVMNRVGKKRAGRLLDGREWSEFPEEVTRV
jgi:protein gp37